MKTNFEKISVKKPVDTQFHDTEGHAYISKARKEKRNKPQRGTGIKGAFRNAPRADTLDLIYG